MSHAIPSDSLTSASHIPIEQIVDSFSGRVLEGRRYSDGLHQSLEAKEGLEVSTQGQVTAQVTYQSLFRSFPRLAGMTGTAATDAREFENTYGLEVRL